MLPAPSKETSGTLPALHATSGGRAMGEGSPTCNSRSLAFCRLGRDMGLVGVSAPIRGASAGGLPCPRAIPHGSPHVRDRLGAPPLAHPIPAPSTSSEGGRAPPSSSDAGHEDGPTPAGRRASYTPDSFRAGLANGVTGRGTTV